MCRRNSQSECVATESGEDWGVVDQVVIPVNCQQQVLPLAHERIWSGHLGITKTYNRVLKEFFWPGLISDVVRFLFFTTYGLPKAVQTDQGINFLFRVFKQTMLALGISHSVSSAYHQESQGALERWHQTLNQC